MEAELRQYLEAMESRLGDRFESRLRDQIGSLETRLNDRFESLETRLNDRFESLETRVNDPIESVETKLLSAFFDWARPVDIRLRTLPMLEERLGLLEERVSKIERGDRPSFERGERPS
jgi:hypothetical protein